MQQKTVICHLHRSQILPQAAMFNAKSCYRWGHVALIHPHFGCCFFHLITLSSLASEIMFFAVILQHIWDLLPAVLFRRFLTAFHCISSFPKWSLEHYVQSIQILPSFTLMVFSEWHLRSWKMWITNKIWLQLHCVGGNSLNFSQKIYFYLQNCPVASLHKCLWMPNFISATGSQCNFWAPPKICIDFKMGFRWLHLPACYAHTLYLLITETRCSPLGHHPVTTHLLGWTFSKSGSENEQICVRGQHRKTKSTLSVLPGGILFPPPRLHQTCSAIKCWASERRFCLAIIWKQTKGRRSMTPES